MFVAKYGQSFLKKTNLEISLQLGGEVDFATLLSRHLLLVDHVGAVLRTEYTEFTEYTRVVTAAFWRTFHHEGKISLSW